MKGVKLRFGSVSEALAINAFARQRTIDFMSPLFAVVDSKQLSKAVKQYRLSIFPEEEDDDANYIKKAEAYFKKIKNVHLKINPQGSEPGRVPINRARR